MFSKIGFFVIHSERKFQLSCNTKHVQFSFIHFPLTYCNERFFRANHALFEKSVRSKFHARRRSRLLTTFPALMTILKVEYNYNGFNACETFFSPSLVRCNGAFTSCDCSNVVRNAAITADTPRIILMPVHVDAKFGYLSPPWNPTSYACS